MKAEDVSLEDAPRNGKFYYIFKNEFIRWAVYEPTTIEADIPLGDKWWAILYWIPKIKKDLYLLLLQKNLNAVLYKLYVDYGIDEQYFKQNYGHILARLRWMEKHNKASSHLGETHD